MPNKNLAVHDQVMLKWWWSGFMNNITTLKNPYGTPLRNLPICCPAQRQTRRGGGSSWRTEEWREDGHGWPGRPGIGTSGTSWSHSWSPEMTDEIWWVLNHHYDQMTDEYWIIIMWSYDETTTPTLCNKIIYPPVSSNMACWKMDFRNRCFSY